MHLKFIQIIFVKFFKIIIFIGNLTFNKNLCNNDVEVVFEGKKNEKFVKVLRINWSCM